ncbi:uncharacterized protein J3R85_016163 [Psidium guajava]|nr:uncharacterized protein J3R85_016163 [Psidium guajava]
MADNSHNMSFQAGAAKGQAQAGQQMMAKAQGAADAVKNATGMNK